MSQRLFVDRRLVLPILLLIVLLTKPNPWASHAALPFADAFTTWAAVVAPWMVVPPRSRQKSSMSGSTS